LRFDFTGLGKSGGDFASTNFSSNQEDLKVAADYLREHFDAPSILIGHSLGGAAVLSVASDIPEIKAVVTIGAPAEAEHVAHNFGTKLDDINTQGEATVSLGGREFSIRKQFLDDLQNNDVLEKVAKLHKPVMVMHSPIDETVGVENASKIFVAAKHPKSFISLDHADHLVSRDEDADFVASMIASWSDKYITKTSSTNELVEQGITRVRETGMGKFQNTIAAGSHNLFADEPKSVGGLDSGPSPYDYLAASLGACTSMTLRMYASFKKLDLGRITVNVSHQKIHAKDCEECTHEKQSDGGKIDVFNREIHVEGLDDDTLEAKIIEIANKCPVHKSLEKGALVHSSVTNITNL